MTIRPFPLPAVWPVEGASPARRTSASATTRAWRAISAPPVRAGPHLQVGLGRAEERPQRLLSAPLSFDVGDQVGVEAVVRDAVLVEVVLARAGDLTDEGDVAVVGAERVAERMAGGVRARSRRRVEAAGVGAEADAEEVLRALVLTQVEDRRRQLRRRVGPRRGDAAEPVQAPQLGRRPGAAGPGVARDERIIGGLPPLGGRP